MRSESMKAIAIKPAAERGVGENSEQRIIGQQSLALQGEQSQADEHANDDNRNDKVDGEQEPDCHAE